DGTFQEFIPYRTHALAEQIQGQIQTKLDAVYLGDDAKKDGNDYPAGEALGFDRFISVSKDTKDKVPQELQPNYIGGLEPGTAKFLQAVTSYARQNPNAPIFTQENLPKLIEEARGARMANRV